VKNKQDDEHTYHIRKSITYKPNHYTKEALSSVTNAADILRMFWNPETIEYYEECKVLYLDRANHILGVYNVSRGGLNGTLMDVRMIYQGALKANAHSIIVSHNPTHRATESRAKKTGQSPVK
jgi:DNA repair protein RadC